MGGLKVNEFSRRAKSIKYSHPIMLKPTLNETLFFYIEKK